MQPKRSRKMRRIVSPRPSQRLDSKTTTCSFGVTQVQPGDDPDTLICRADRALLQAKEVVAIGSSSWAQEARPTDHPVVSDTTSSPGGSA